MNIGRALMNIGAWLCALITLGNVVFCQTNNNRQKFWKILAQNNTNSCNTYLFYGTIRKLDLYELVGVCHQHQ